MGNIPYSEPGVIWKRTAAVTYRNMMTLGGLRSKCIMTLGRVCRYISPRSTSRQMSMRASR